MIAGTPTILLVEPFKRVQPQGLSTKKRRFLRRKEMMLANWTAKK